MQCRFVPLTPERAQVPPRDPAEARSLSQQIWNENQGCGFPAGPPVLLLGPQNILGRRGSPWRCQMFRLMIEMPRWHTVQFISHQSHLAAERLKCGSLI